jgi:hypothetical protein
LEEIIIKNLKYKAFGNLNTIQGNWNTIGKEKVIKDMEIIIQDLMFILIKITMMETTIEMVDKFVEISNKSEATQDRLEMFVIKEKKAIANFIKKEIQIKEIVMEINIENGYKKP